VCEHALFRPAVEEDAGISPAIDPESLEQLHALDYSGCPQCAPK
jgi:hypothetical protein